MPSQLYQVAKDYEWRAALDRMGAPGNKHGHAVVELDDGNLVLFITGNHQEWKSWPSDDGTEFLMHARAGARDKNAKLQSGQQSTFLFFRWEMTRKDGRPMDFTYKGEVRYLRQEKDAGMLHFVFALT